ncbi:MAG: sugar transferase, partial [Lachnospiraceae bacterium]|nr:sugar transferase [Lachnospiraceae bacterium]
MKTSAERGRKKYRFRLICGIAETGIDVALFFLFWMGLIAFDNPTGHLKGTANILMSVGIYTVIFFSLWKTLGGYRLGVNRVINTISSQVISILLTNLSNTLISMAVTGQFRLGFILLREYMCLWLLQSIVTSFISFPMIKLYKAVFPPLNVVEVYGDNINYLDEKVNTRPDKYCVRRRIRYTESEEVIRSCIDEYDAVIINDIPSKDKNRILKFCFDMDKRVYFTPKLSDIIVRASEDLNLFDTPLYLCRNNGMSKLQMMLKRLFDIVLSFIALIILSPVMLITAFAIKYEDGGPVFFRQERVTIGNKHFMIIKFRSMVTDAEIDGRPNPAKDGDSRITKTGRFIRACRIDEIPQLINILKGEMSIVGPRPERVEHVEKYTAEIPEFTFRSKVKGGLTGYAQV